MQRGIKESGVKADKGSTRFEAFHANMLIELGFSPLRLRIGWT